MVALAVAVVVWGGEDERGRRMGNKGSFWKKKKKKLSLLRVRLCRRAKAHMADEKQREDIATHSSFPAIGGGNSISSHASKRRFDSLKSNFSFTTPQSHSQSEPIKLPPLLDTHTSGPPFFELLQVYT